MTRSATPTILILWLVCSAPLAAQPLQHQLALFLDQPPLDRHLWGIAVLDGQGRLLFGRNEDRLFIPASNTKLVVTSVATGLLPPEWTVRTSVYGSGTLAEGRLQGDLVLYGRGDPTMSRRCFAVDTTAPGACLTDASLPLRILAGQLRRIGVREIAGDLIGDGSYFEPVEVHPTWENEDLTFDYAAPVSGLGFNENTVLGTVTPGAAIGAIPTVTLEPAFPDFELVVRTHFAFVDPPAGNLSLHRRRHYWP